MEPKRNELKYGYSLPKSHDPHIIPLSETIKRRYVSKQRINREGGSVQLKFWWRLRAAKTLISLALKSEEIKIERFYQKNTKETLSI